MSGYIIGSGGGGGGGGGELTWIDYVTGYSSVPTLNTALPAGDVYTYPYNNDALTLYRFIATDGSEDSFYNAFDGTNLSGLVVSKEITV